MTTTVQDAKKRDYKSSVKGAVEVVERIAAEREEKKGTDIISDIKQRAYSGDVEGLIPFLDHKDWRIRTAAVLGLGHIGDARVLKPLVGVWKDDEDEWVREQARDISRAIWHRMTRPLGLQ
ncbi:MAG: HEAT repeat domain-containing protein [Chloroflexota bacterium]|nr:HEAT repeat domain-containing protein [Chloroflexota bacterium]